jgi:hypothetical protein
MGLLDKVNKAKKEKEDYEKEKTRKEKEERDRESSYQKQLCKCVSEALDELDGHKECKVTKNENMNEWTITKKGNCLAKVKVTYGTWENPNYDYKVEESGYYIVWEINPDSYRSDNYSYRDSGYRHGAAHYKGYFADSFARDIAEFI